MAALCIRKLLSSASLDQGVLFVALLGSSHIMQVPGGHTEIYP